VIVNALTTEMKKTLQIIFLLGLLMVFNFELNAQNITVEIDPIDIGAVEINQTNDCLRQNNNNWYGNVCDVVNDGDDPENTTCDDCFTGGSEDIDVATVWEAGGNWSAPHVINDVLCGYNSSFNWTPGAGGTNTVWTVAKTETIRVAISGAEDDAFVCSGDLSGSNDGECFPSPYGYATNNLPWAYRTYNANTASWYTDNGVGLDIDASRCPYDWTGNNNSTIENCMKENGTNDYSFRWRYRWHFGDAAGNLSGMNAPDIDGLDFTTCSGPYDRTTLTATSFTDCDYATQWQVSVNGGAYTDIVGGTANTYDPPSRSCGVYAYRVRKAYRTSFAGATGYTYSNTRTDIIQTAATAGVIGTAQSICIGGDPAVLTNTTSGTGCGTISYIWQSSVSPFSTWNTIVGATGSTYDPPAGLGVTTQYRRITRSALTGGNTCDSPANYSRSSYGVSRSYHTKCYPLTY
jgi:hypothetical protein